MQAGGLYWVATSRENVSPSVVLELLMRIHSICRDYFGYVTEEVRAAACLPAHSASDASR